MKDRIVKMVPLLFLALAAACATPATPRMAPKSGRDPDVERIASLMSSRNYPKSRKSRNLPDSREISQLIVGSSRLYGVDPFLIAAIIRVESGFQPWAKSPVGAIGLMQVMPVAARDQGWGFGKRDLYDPATNVFLGVRYFAFLRERYGKDLPKALVAYNLGPAALDRRLLRRPFVPTDYFWKVMKFYERFLNSSS